HPALPQRRLAPRGHAERALAARVPVQRAGGMYGAVKLLDDDAVTNAARACCADVVCLRRVAWGVDGDTPMEMMEEGAPVGDARVPCPEACSMFISFARQVLKTERAPRQAVAGLVPMGSEEIRQIQALVAAAGNGTLGRVREGEFDDPLNTRRIRYLAARLADAEAPEEPELPCEGCPRKTPCAGCPVAADLARPSPRPSR
ncbi:MAG TPA: hypothetical protein VE913_12925, partial [Longimicrobium sp.]|nr:hypothetical protein [Longimicrobium sp.]